MISEAKKKRGGIRYKAPSWQARRQKSTTAKKWRQRNPQSYSGGGGGGGGSMYATEGVEAGLYSAAVVCASGDALSPRDAASVAALARLLVSEIVEKRLYKSQDLETLFQLFVAKSLTARSRKHAILAVAELRKDLGLDRKAPSHLEYNDKTRLSVGAGFHIGAHDGSTGSSAGGAHDGSTGSSAGTLSAAETSMGSTVKMNSEISRPR
jgi:hypothetical protein